MSANTPAEVPSGGTYGDRQGPESSASAIDGSTTGVGSHSVPTAAGARGDAEQVVTDNAAAAGRHHRTLSNGSSSHNNTNTHDQATRSSSPNNTNTSNIPPVDNPSPTSHNAGVTGDGTIPTSTTTTPTPDTTTTAVSTAAAATTTNPSTASPNSQNTFNRIRNRLRLRSRLGGGDGGSTATTSTAKNKKRYPFTHTEEGRLRRKCIIFATLLNILALSAILNNIVGPIPGGISGRQRIASSITNMDMNLVSWSELYQRNMTTVLTSSELNMEITLAMTWHLSAFCFEEVTQHNDLDGIHVQGCVYHAAFGHPFHLESLLRDVDNMIGEEYRRNNLIAGGSRARRVDNLLAPAILHLFAFLCILLSLTWLLLVKTRVIRLDNAVPWRWRPHIIAQYTAVLLLIAGSAIMHNIAIQAYNILRVHRAENFPKMGKSLPSVNWAVVVGQLLAALLWEASDRMVRRLQKPERYPRPIDLRARAHGNNNGQPQQPPQHQQQPQSQQQAQSLAAQPTYPQSAANNQPPSPHSQHSLHSTIPPISAPTLPQRPPLSTVPDLGAEFAPPPYSAYDPLHPPPPPRPVEQHSSHSLPHLDLGNNNSNRLASPANSGEAIEMTSIGSARSNNYPTYEHGGDSRDVTDIMDEASDGIVANGDARGGNRSQRH